MSIAEKKTMVDSLLMQKLEGHQGMCSCLLRGATPAAGIFSGAADRMVKRWEILESVYGSVYGSVTDTDGEKVGVGGRA